MIRDKKDLERYLSEDSTNYKSLLGWDRWANQSCTDPISDQWYIWKYIKTLRYCEYYKSKNAILYKFLLRWHLHKLRKYSRITGFQIPPDTVGAGLTIWHWGPIIINPKTRIGRNCILNPMVVIGHKAPGEPAPVIGDNVFIGAGAKIIGDIRIGDNVTVAPNAVVVKDVPSDATVGGVPAKVIK